MSDINRLIYSASTPAGPRLIEISTIDDEYLPEFIGDLECGGYDAPTVSETTNATFNDYLPVVRAGTPISQQVEADEPPLARYQMANPRFLWGEQQLFAPLRPPVAQDLAQMRDFFDDIDDDTDTDDEEVFQYLTRNFDELETLDDVEMDRYEAAAQRYFDDDYSMDGRDFFEEDEESEDDL